MDLETLQRLYSEQEIKNKGGMAVEDVLAMQALAAKLEDINLEKVLARKADRRPEMEKAIELKIQGKIKRRPKKKGPGRPRIHWKTKDKRRKKWLVEVNNPRRWAREAEQWKTGEGWYEYLTKQWYPLKVELTLDQWLTDVYQHVEGHVFTCQRYNTKEPIRLDNIILKKGKKVLFDGKEHWLKANGYCL